jgi:lipooligosaccharide transport system ATP-binding protein
MLLDLPVPQAAREARIRVGVVPQMDNLDPDFTVAENLLVYGRYFGMKDAEIEARIPSLLEFASLTSKRDAKVPTLSGGMKRRLTLARALVNDPDVIFLDEPTTGLDPQARHLIWQRLRALTQQGKTLLLTTHFMDEAERLCHRLAVMDNGKLISQGSPRELIEQNIEPQVVEVFGETSGQWANEHAAHYAQRFEVSGESVFCYVRDAQPLVAHLQALSELRYLHRPANLEDVFLKLTGREMRE